MKLLRLILQGFKSFADKTTIDFSEGMTVIVGPNGCGKSNISDAVRWVLGEQNVRNLRGQKAEDIIFSGSETRPKKNGAEVTLVLDNTNRELPLDTAEVSITRRLLRNGDSDFEINKRNCRLKDIQELLANTGLGKGSLAIIGQNRVDQVLTARPEERRLIFEDVAGISLYRMRKNEGLRKLEKTAENMERVKDMTALLDEQLIPLKEEAEKAKVYKMLLREKRSAEATASLLKLTSVRRMLARYENEYRDMEAQEQGAETELLRFAAVREKMETEALQQKSGLQEAGERTAEAQRKMEEIRGDFRVKEEALRHRTEKKAELAEAEADQREAEKELSEERQTAEKELAEALEAADRQEKILAAAEEEKRKMEESLRRAEEEYAEVLAVSRREMAEKEKLVQTLSLAGEEIRRLLSEKEELERNLQEAEASLKETEAQLAQTEKEEASGQELLAREEEKGKKDSAALKEAQDRRFALMNESSRLRSELAGFRSKREYLEKAEKEYAGFSMASRTIMNHRELFGDSVQGVLGDLIRVPALYTDAAEIALGGRISHIVTDTGAAAARIIEWLKQKHLGRTTFYPLDSMRAPAYAGIETEAAKEPGICGIASQLLSCDKEYKALLDALLGKTLIAETLDDARRTAKKYHYKLRIVTLDGQLVNAGGSLTGGSMKKSENTYFGRKKEIELLIRREAEVQKNLKAGEEAEHRQRELCETLAERVTEERNAWQQMKEKLAVLQGKKEGLLSAKADRENSHSASRAKWDSLTEALETARKKEADCRISLEGYRDIPEPGEDTKSRDIRKNLEKKQEEILSLHVALTKAQEKAAFGKRMEAERLAAAKEQQKEREKLEAEIAENEAAAASLAAELETLRKDFDEAEKAWQESRTRQEKLQEDSDTSAVVRKQNEESWQKAQEKVYVLRRDLAERKGRIESFRGQEQEELQKLEERRMSLSEAEELRIPGSMQDIQKKEADIQARMEALGSVNPHGEEEYEKQLARRKFYEDQLTDLDQARTSLETVVKDIDQTMEKEFSQAFVKINEEFGRIMQLMFRGGNARLELTDTNHPLEGGVEMYLQLPGKKRQPLTLMSGGERALTVIALLISFMAYRPAPFCFVDEIDAALDDANVERYSRMIADYKKKTQFIVISHRKKTMEFADTLQGVTMGEKGVSSLVTVKMKDYVE